MDSKGNEELHLQHLENYKETLQQMTKEELIEEGLSSMTEHMIKLYFEEIERRQSLIPNNVAWCLNF